MPFTATWKDLEIVMLSEVRQTEKDKHQMISLICGILKNDKNELIYETEQTYRLREWTYSCHGGRMGKTDRQFGISINSLLYLKWLTNKDLLYSMVNSAQCYVAAQIGGKFGGE